MGYQLTKQGIDALFEKWAEAYTIYAPKRHVGGGMYSDTDCVRYNTVKSVSEIEFEEKSDFSFKEILLPISETLFYFSEETMREATAPPKGAIVFLRSCDLHAVKRLDDMYLNNGPIDYYYSRLREKVHFVLMGCETAFDSCFCVDMGTNISQNYDLSIDKWEEGYHLDCQKEDWIEHLSALSVKQLSVTPAYVTKTPIQVTIPENLSAKVGKSLLWDEYDTRCIACGRCNFVCPTCTCFTMQDLFYTDNGRSGERRRIWASCMVDGYSDVAGGGSYRQKNGQRMRFKVLHKVFDYKKRTGYHMCVGCGRCDDVCPEYISFSKSVNALENAMKEVLESE